MKNIYFTFSQASSSLLKRTGTFLLLALLMMFAHVSTYAQACNPALAKTITVVDATLQPSGQPNSDTKVRISGLTNFNYKVGIEKGTSYSGSFAGASLYSSLVGGYVVDTLSTQNLTNPADRTYTLRVYKDDGSCFTDSTFVLPYLNIQYTPEYVDLEATITRMPNDDVPLGSTVTVTVAVKNDGNLDATGVVFDLAYPGALQYVTSTTANGTFDNTNNKWTIGNIPKKAANGVATVYTLVITYVVNARGIFEVTAQNSALNEIDKDSSPVPNAEVEDDEGQLCITTHRDYCNGDEFTFKLASGVYTGVVWQYSPIGSTTWTDITGSTAYAEIAADGSLLIKGEGNFKYIRAAAAGVCAFDGCCPIKVIPGLPPILSNPNNQVICFGSPAPTFTSVNSQAGYTPTSNVSYGITTVLPAFLPDQMLGTDNTQGNYKYQWYNMNGTNNPTLDSLTGETNLALTAATLPTAVGTYKYYVKGWMDGHKSCVDSASVTFIINELPIPLASSNSPVCEEQTIRFRVINTSPNPIPGITWTWTGPAQSGFTSNDSIPTIANSEVVKHSGIYVVSGSYSQNGLGCEAKDSVTVVVNPLPIKPNGIDTVYCQEIVAKRLSAIKIEPIPAGQHNGDSLYWYAGLTNPLINPDLKSGIGYNVGPIPNTSVNAGTYYYYVSQVDNNGCESHKDTLTVLLNAKPAPPTPKNWLFCENAPTRPLTAIKGGNGSGYQLSWTDPVGGKDTADTYPGPNTAVLGVRTYQVAQFETATGCMSRDTSFLVDVKDTPLAPAANDPIYCLNDSTNVLTAALIAPSKYLNWYFNGNKTTAAPKPTSNIPGATWYYVTQTSEYGIEPQYGGVDTLLCESPQEPIKVTVNPLPSASLIPVNALCNGTISLNNGQLILTRYRNDDVVAWNAGSAFTAPGTFNPLPASEKGVIAKNLANPSVGPDPYTARVRNEFGCILDVFTQLTKVDCTCPGGYCEPAAVTKTK